MNFTNFHAIDKAARAAIKQCKESSYSLHFCAEEQAKKNRVAASDVVDLIEKYDPSLATHI